MYIGTMKVNTDSHTGKFRANRTATEIRQEQITHATLDLISNSGTIDINISSIAEQVGIAPSAVYRHFTGKEQILLAVNNLIRKNLMKNIHSVRQQTADPVQQLHFLLHRHIVMVRENPGIPRYVFSTAALTQGTERKAQLFEGVRRYLDELEKMFAAAQARSQIYEHLNPETLAFMYLGLIQPAIFLNQLGDGYADIEVLAQNAWQVLLEHICIKDPEGSEGEKMQMEKTV